MVSRGNRYDTTCHVLDADTVVVQGMRFVKEKTCNNAHALSTFFKCSECGFPESGSISDQWLESEVNYCPHCGAKVIGG